MGVYDARKVVATADGVFITGFAEDSMVTAEKDNDGMEASTDAQGNPIVSINGDNLGTITVELSQTSPSVKYLDNLANTRKIFPFWVNSNNEIKEVAGGTRCFVTKPSGAGFGKKAGNRTFVIKALDYQKK